MNKNQFRLIFNRARSMMMVVAETVRSHTAGSGTKSATDLHKNHAVMIHQAASQGIALRPLAFSIMLAMGMVGFIPNNISINTVHAEIIADPSAPANQRPIILNAPNGVPLVNIQTPSAAGVSRNTYSQFDVNNNGVILNNSRTNVQTQLGGFVQGNPYLATGTARIILNEVNSSNPSYLNGYIEVAGSRAQVVIANPAGISCSGCGFINASRATLTTGTPIINGGDLMGYRVGGGTINFLGAGFDASQTNYTDNIARVVNVNAGIWAQNLNVLTGSNQVNVASIQNGTDAYITSITPIAGTGSTPAFAVDVAALGGMYAGKIHMVGTESGLGVRNAGNIGASAGNVTIDANGLLGNSGTLSSRGAGNDLGIKTQGLNNTGTISAQNNIRIDNQGAVQNSGLITSDRELKLNTFGLLTNNQGTLSAQRLDIHAASLSNNLGTIQQTGLQALSLNSQGLTNINNGVIGNIPVVAGGTGSGSAGATTGNGSAGATTSTPPISASNGSAVVITPSAPVILADGVIAIQGLAHNDGGQITANGSLTANISNTLANSAVINLDKIKFTGTTFSNANGSINAAQAFINTNLLDNSQGQFIVSNALQITAHDVLNYQGTLQQLGVANLSLDLLGNLDNTQGRIETNAQSLTLGANQLSNNGGSIIHTGTTALNITSTTLNGTSGLIQTNGALNLTALTAALDNADTLAQQINITTATLSNKGGNITQTGSGATSIRASTLLDNTSGTIASNGNSTFTVGSLVNQAGSIQAAGSLATGFTNLTINATGTIDNSALNGVAGEIQASGSSTLTANSLNNSQGNISAGNTLTVTTVQGLDNSQGLIAANQQLAVSASNINNTSGTLASVQAGTNLIATSGAINNSLGSITAAQTLTTSSFGVNNANGKLNANAAQLNSQALTFNNTQGTLVTTANLDIQSGALINDAGLIQTGSNLTVNTHGQTFTNINSGTLKGILSQGTASLTTGNLNNQTGYIGAAGALTANSALINSINGVMTSEAAVSLNATSLDNQSGRIESIGDVGIATVGAINNQSGLLRAGQTLNLSTATIDNRNTLGSNQGIEGQNVVIVSDAINNNLGSIRADDSLNITGSGSLNNSQGLISSTGSLKIADRVANANTNVTTKTLDIINTGGNIIAQQNLSIDSRSLTGDGSVVSQGTLSTKLTTNFTNTATSQWQAQGNASLVTTGTITNQSLISSSANLNINAANINNLATGEISGFNTNLNATNTLNNRGLIDGSDTFTNANILNNIGTGRIYGDQIAIATNTLNNTDETIAGVNKAAVIASRDSLNIGVANINNINNSLLFSVGNMNIGGSLDVNYQASSAAGQTQTATLINQGATIEALGNLNANVTNLQNRNAGITTQTVFAGSTAYHQFTPRGVSVILDAADYPGAQIGNVGVSWRSAGPYTFREYYRYLYTDNTYETQVLSSAPAQLLSSGNMTFNGNITNSDSKIIAGGLLDVTGATLNNLNTQGQSTTSYNGTLYYYDYDGSGSGFRYRISAWAYNPASSVTSFNLPTTQVLQNTAPVGTGTQIGTLSTIGVNQTATGAGTATAQANAITTTPVVTTVVSSSNVNGQSVSSLVGTASPNLTLPTNSLFQTNPNLSRSYLIETDPRFADYRTWLSSDYMLTQLSYDPATQTQRLGDGFTSNA